MIWDFEHKIQFTLCSQSPRRWEILKDALGVTNLRTNVCHQEDEVDFQPETWNKDSIIAYNERIARFKAQSVDFSEELENGIFAEVIVGADTIIATKDYSNVYEKAKDREHAKKMIEKLCQDRTHSTFTAVSFKIKTRSGRIFEKTFTEETIVTFAQLDDAQIEAYLDQNDWQGKAGAYGIQVTASSVVEKIEGTFHNVLGFPVHAFAQNLIFLRDVIIEEEKSPLSQ